MKNIRPFIISAFLILLVSFPAKAHWADMAAMEVSVSGNEANAELTIPTQFLSEADIDKDGKISDNEIKKSYLTIEKVLNNDVYINSDGEKGKLSIYPSQTSKSDITGSSSQSTLKLKWVWEKSGKTYKLHYSLFLPEAVNAHCLVSTNIEGKTSTITFNQRNTESYLKEMTTFESIKEFIFLGVEHIATGYDHILFLIALLLAGGGFRYLIKIVTAFTIAHSITLTLAALSMINVSSRFVESCIAASIIYVAAENLWRKKDEAHWSLVFLFGLIHGLGFASVLGEMDLPKTNLAETLISFNIGIEIGQLVIVGISWSILNMIHKSKDTIYQKLKSGGSVAIIGVASVWFVQRAFF